MIVSMGVGAIIFFFCALIWLVSIAAFAQALITLGSPSSATTQAAHFLLTLCSSSAQDTNLLLKRLLTHARSGIPLSIMS